MKKGKKLLALLLCVMMMMGVLVLPASAAGGVCATYSDHQWVIDSPVIGDYCPWTNGAEHTWQHCSVCGLGFNIITRTNGAPVYDETGRQHNWVAYGSVSSACPNNPWKTQICTNCNTVIFVTGSGEHNWSAWKSDNASGPCGGTETRTCACGAHETRSTGSGHKWQTVSQTAATCTQAGSLTKQCSVCGEQETTTTPALGHDYHYNSYWYNDTHHWNQCSRCNQIQNPASHTPGSSGICTVCGAKVNLPAAPSTPAPTPSGPDPSTCRHNYVVSGQANVGSIKQHVEKCTICGKEIEVYCSGKTRALSRTSCTEPLMCQCGNQIEAARASHYSGGWTTTDTTHKRVCKNSGCQYVSPAEPHKMVTTNGVSKCSVCGYIDPVSRAAHNHVWGVWTSNGSGHSHPCTVPGCSATQDLSHNLGAVNCRGEAVCKDCGATVTGRPAGSTHTGGTEIRGSKAAQVGVAGYTGDTYCLGCGKKISSGKTIPALTAGHTHSYASTWSQDGTHHWKACSCGGKQDEAEHTFHEGVCSVCGYKNPDYVDAKEHVHVYSADWSHDTNSHWNVCTVGGCKEVANKASHTIVNGKCTSCGFTLKDYTEEKQEEQVVESHTPVVEDKQQLIETATDMFKDVNTKDYYASSVGWAVQLNITNGTSTSAKTFSPNDTCTQIQILTMLYRAQRGTSTANAADMNAAVAWATELGIIDSNFNRNAPCTRATAVTYMWKAAGSPASAAGVSFNDVTDDSAYEQAVAWAVSSGVTNGTSKSTFSPNETCNRGQIVTFLYRDAVEPLQ